MDKFGFHTEGASNEPLGVEFGDASPGISEKVEQNDATCAKSDLPTDTGFFSTMSALRRDYGLQLLIMISLSSHWCKGFCRSQYMQSIRYLLQAWNVSGPRIDSLTAIIEVPWSLKPMLALCSDLFPLFGYSKNPYIFLTTVLGIAGLCVACFISPESSVPAELPAGGLFLATFAWMTCDILVEGVYSRRMGEHVESGPSLVVFINVGQQIAVLISSLLSGFVLEHLDGFQGLSGAQWNLAFCIVPTSLVLLPVCFNYLGESKTSPARSILRTQKEVVALSFITCIGSLIFVTVGIVSVDSTQPFFITALVVLLLVNFSSWFFLRPIIGRLVLFLAIASASNLSLGGAAHYFYTDPPSAYPEGPHFEPWFFVTVCGLAGAVASIAASLVFVFFKSVSFRKIYTVFILLNAALSLPNCLLFARVNLTWGISDYWFVASDTVVQSAMNVLYFIPGFLLLSRVCPNKIESTMFAILASNTNLAQTITYPISGYICEGFGIVPTGADNESSVFDNLWIANIVMAGIKLAPLACISLLPACRMTDAVVHSDDPVNTNSPLSRFIKWIY